MQRPGISSRLTTRPGMTRHSGISRRNSDKQRPIRCSLQDTGGSGSTRFRAPRVSFLTKEPVPEACGAVTGYSWARSSDAPDFAFQEDLAAYLPFRIGLSRETGVEPPCNQGIDKRAGQRLDVGGATRCINGADHKDCGRVPRCRSRASRHTQTRLSGQQCPRGSSFRI